MDWRYRHLTKDNLFGLYLLLKMCQKNKKGVYLTNSCLRQVLDVEKVHKPNINDFAGKIGHLFPYKKIKKDYYNLRNELILMVVKEDSINTSEYEKF